MKQFRAAVPIDYKAHVLQSAGVLAFAEPAGAFDMVRAGIILYGISPLPGFQKLLKPAMTWKTRISLVRDIPKGSSISYGRTFITPREMRVATLSAGYADGYPWHLSNRDRWDGSSSSDSGWAESALRLQSIRSPAFLRFCS